MRDATLSAKMIHTVILFLDDFMPELLHEGLYHADGQILDEVYVYGSFIQSKMYHEGVSCMNCHNPHSLQLRQEGNQLCTSCHQTAPPTQQFPTLVARDYDTPEHHFHQADSAGAQCVNCHMPTQTYMILDPRRDHSFSIPRPDLTLEWATPNACAQCHADGQREACAHSRRCCSSQSAAGMSRADTHRLFIC